MQQVHTFLEKDLILFNKKLRGYLKTNVYLLDKIMGYVVRSKGKQLRPIFVLLTARLFSDQLSERVFRAAACIEILHTATLIHDDVVDKAEKRRHFFSLNALWKNKIAVLAGDYLLSKGLLIALSHNDYDTLRLLSEAVQKMSEGELLQFQKARNLSMNEKVYFEVIEGKTASLIAAACALGVPENEPKSIIALMKKIGLHIGLAFQIKDDLLDFTHYTGKPYSQDLKDKKITLPLIYTLQNSNFWERQKIRYYLQRLKYDTPKNPERINWIIEECHKKGGFTRATQQMELQLNLACQQLHTLPPSPTRENFDAIINFIRERQS